MPKPWEVKTPEEARRLAKMVEESTKAAHALAAGLFYEMQRLDDEASLSDEGVDEIAPESSEDAAD